MKKNCNKLFKLEWDSEGEKVEMHLNDVGIDYLINQLQELKGKSGNSDVHLMTPSWGGEELTEGPCEAGYSLVNHLKIYKWNDQD